MSANSMSARSVVSVAAALYDECEDASAAGSTLAASVGDMDAIESALQLLNRRLHRDPTDTEATNALRVVGDAWARMAPNGAAIAHMVDESA